MNRIPYEKGRKFKKKKKTFRREAPKKKFISRLKLAGVKLDDLKPSKKIAKYFETCLDSQIGSITFNDAAVEVTNGLRCSEKKSRKLSTAVRGFELNRNKPNFRFQLFSIDLIFFNKLASQ